MTTANNKPLTAEEIAELREKARYAEAGVPDVAVLRRHTLRSLLDEVERSRRIPLADEADVKKLLAIIERSRVLLKRIEWGNVDGWSACPECDGEMPCDPKEYGEEYAAKMNEHTGHRPGCELAALIGGSEAAPNLLPILQRLVDAVTESGRKGVVYLGSALGDAREALRLSGVRPG